MSDALLYQVASTLAAAGIPSALIGAGALAIHGVSRSTFDRDLLVTDVRVLDRRIWMPLGEAAEIDVRHGDADDPLGGVVRVTAGADMAVDVIVGRHRWQARLVEEASAARGAEGSVSVVSPSGLVLLKLYAGGPQDLWDIVQLRAVHGHSLDAAVNERIAALPDSARDAWQRLVGGSF